MIFSRRISDMSSSDSGPPMTASEYSDSVRDWLVQAYQWQAISYSFPSYLAFQASLQQQQSNQAAAAVGNEPEQRANTRPVLQEQNNQEIEWHEFTIPPLWKRIVAELIDFFILFLLKLLVTYFFIDGFGLIDVDRYDMSFLSVVAGESSLNLQDAVDLTSDFVLLESIHRLVVCVFEALCLHKGFGGRPGGATPGKYVMGLRVVSCIQITSLPDPSRVQITPAKDIGIVGASIRAVLKNAAMAFFVPVFFTFIYNRTVYDIMSKSIVVEDQPAAAAQQQRRPHQD